MYAVLFIVALALFVALNNRVHRLEQKFDALTKENMYTPTLGEENSTQVKEPVPVYVPGDHIEKQDVHPEPAPALASETMQVKKDDGHDGTTEFAVGSKLFTGVGIFAILLAVGFFLRYAFENNLISPSVRVLIGIVFGLLLGGIGHKLREKYTVYGLSLVGAGMGAVYIAIYAAYGFYGLISASVAIVLMILLTVGSVGVTLRYDSEHLVSFAFMGGFLVPFLVEISAVHIYFWYLILLNAGVLVIARYKKWPVLTVASLIATSLLCLNWGTGTLMPAFAYVTTLFLIYFSTSALNFVFRDRDYRGIDGFLTYGVPTVYFLISLGFFHTKNDIALLALGVGVFYALAAVIFRAGFAQFGDLKKFSHALVVIAAPYIVLATALHFDGNAMTMALAAESVAMLLVGLLLNSRGNRVMAMGIAVIAGIHVFGPSIAPGASVIFNGRAATYLIVTVMFGVFWFVYHMYKKNKAVFIDENDKRLLAEREAGGLIGTIGLFVIPWIWVFVEMNEFVHEAMLYVPLAWACLYAAILSLAAVAHDKKLRTLAYFGIAAGFAVVLAFQWHLDLSTHTPFANVRVLTVLVYAVLCGYGLWLVRVLHEDSDKVKVVGDIRKFLLFIPNILLLWAGSLEIIGYFDIGRVHAGSYMDAGALENTKRIALSAYWLFYASAALTVGIVFRSSYARYLSTGLFSIVIFKIFLYDTANLSDIYRFVSFFLLGVILLAAGYFYYRFKGRIMNFVKADN